MRPSQIFLATILFLGMFTGVTNFLNSLYSHHDVQTNTTVEIHSEYSQLQKEIMAPENSLYSKLATITTSEGSLLDTATAGLLIVPQFIGILLAPVTILTSTIDGIAAAFPIIPDWLVLIAKLMIYSTISYAAFSLLVGMRS